MYYYTIPCTNIQYHTLFYDSMHYCTRPCTTIQDHALLYKTTHYYTRTCTTIQEPALLCETMHHYTRQCTTIQDHTLHYTRISEIYRVSPADLCSDIYCTLRAIKSIQNASTNWHQTQQQGLTRTMQNYQRYYFTTLRWV